MPGRQSLGPGGRRYRVFDSLALLTSSDWRRNEYLGADHLPVFGCRRGRNGFGSVTVACPDVQDPPAGGDQIGRCDVEGIVVRGDEIS